MFHQKDKKPQDASGKVEMKSRNLILPDYRESLLAELDRAHSSESNEGISSQALDYSSFNLDDS